MILGYVMIPSKTYMEAVDEYVMTNVNENITGHFKFHARAWTSNWYTNRVDCVVKDAEGNERIQIEGYYTSEIIAKDLVNGHEWTLF